MNTLQILLACTIIATISSVDAVKRSICKAKNDRPVAWDMVSDEIVTKIAAYCDYDSRNLLMHLSKKFNFLASKENRAILYEPHVKLSEHDTRTFLLLGCKGNDYRMIENLLTNGSDDCNKTNREVALRYAIENNNEALIQFLLPDSSSEHKAMSLFYAVKNNHSIATKTILADVTVSVNTTDKHGHTPLHYAAGKKCVARKLAFDFDQTLLGDPFLGNPFAHNPLIEVKHTETVIELLAARNNINVNAQNNDGETALECAEKKGYGTIVNMLRPLQ